MSLAFWVTPFLLLLFTGCEDLWSEDESPAKFGRTLTLEEQLRTIRRAGAPPATVRGTFELSDAAVAGFRGLDVFIDVYSAESLDGERLRAQWLDEPGGVVVQGPFAGGLSTIWSATLYKDSNPYAAAPRVLNLEVAPEGDWRSELEFPMEYEVYVMLPRQAGAVASDDDLKLTWEESP